MRRKLLLASGLIALAFVGGATLLISQQQEPGTWSEAIRKYAGAPEYESIDPDKPIPEQTVTFEIGGRTFEMPKVFIQSNIGEKTVVEGLNLLYVLPAFTSRADFPDRQAYEAARSERRFAHMHLQSEAGRLSIAEMFESRRTSGLLAKQENAGLVHGLEYLKWYEAIGVDADDWLPNKLLNDSSNPGALWNDLLVNSGGSDLWDDTGVVLEAGAGLLFGPYMLYKGLLDSNGIDPSELEFARNFFNALTKLDRAALEDMLDDYAGNTAMTDLLESMLARPVLPEAPTNIPANDEQEPFGPPESYGPWVDGALTPFGQSETIASPIVLDVDASGSIELAALNGTGSVMWDIDEDGFLEASGWITGGDGLLCVDLNSDGVINDHGELFGGSNGYVTLAAYDTNSSSTITSTDTDFGDLLVWVDSNANGYSETSELHSLTSLGITSISTAYSSVNYAISGNQIKYQSTFVMNGNTYTSVDAFFAYDPTNTEYIGDYTLDLRTVFLPTLRGYGELPDLHIAMSLDETLLEMVEDFAALDASEILGAVINPAGSDIQDILFRWAGVDSVSSTSRGSYIDARVLEFLEEFVGKDYLQFGTNPNPGSNAGPLLMEAWNVALDEFGTRLVYQITGMNALFDDGGQYNPISDTFAEATTLNISAVEDWIEAVDVWNNKVDAARFLVDMVEEIIGVANLTSTQYDDLESLLPYGLSIEALTNVQVASGNLTGGAEDDLLIGYSGNQSMTGNNEDDVFIGYGGQDGMYGGAGNDIYILAAGSGGDTITEALGNGTDTVHLAEYLTSEVRLWTNSSGSLMVTSKANESDQATIYAATTGASGTTYETDIGLYFEKIVFDDATTWSLTGGLSLEGSSNSENLYGSAYNDQIRGEGGNDTLYGNRGNDTLIGGVGNDNLFGGAGNDTYTFSAGDNSDYINESLSSGTDTVRLSGYATTGVRMWTNSGGTLFIEEQ